MIKHFTSSVFVFGLVGGMWKLGVIEHPRLRRWMIAGGHVEPGESQVDAALREVEEETGRQVRLVRPPGPAVPPKFPRTVLTMPWWITEQPVPPDAHCGDRHVHVDHQYVGLVADPDEVTRKPEHLFRWAGLEELDGLAMFADTRLLVGGLFAVVPMLGAGDLDAVSMLTSLAGDVQS
ncbi:NUDIX hydrolase [Saccharothrix deserti]|uniref:NUDIX hydrolase n=1 Tax=Saccharothrix deserti TaxID=2593674 RepID=UPI00131B2834|nr:NUDIX domain-containing protein [Saccharothrix deserti]